jgi:hypothetical protein
VKVLRQLTTLGLAAVLGSLPILTGCGRYGPPARPVAAGRPAASEANLEPERGVFGNDYRDDEPVPYILEGMVEDEPDLETDLETDSEPDAPTDESDARPKRNTKTNKDTDSNEDTPSSE